MEEREQPRMISMEPLDDGKYQRSRLMGKNGSSVSDRFGLRYVGSLVEMTSIKLDKQA